MAKKQFHTQNNIGKVKYVINYHNGIDTHTDGSPFFGIKTFSNKQKFNKEIKNLKNQGYYEN